MAPSKDKKRVAGRAPWEIGELLEIPRSLMEKVAVPKGTGKLHVEAKSPSPPEIHSFVAARSEEKLLLVVGKSWWESFMRVIPYLRLGVT